MLVGLAAAIVVGAIVGLATVFDTRLRIADDAPLAVLVCVSGAVAAWAGLRLIGATPGSGVGIAGVLGPLAGAATIAAEAWRGRRRTLTELDA